MHLLGSKNLFSSVDIKIQISSSNLEVFQIHNTSGGIISTRNYDIHLFYDHRFSLKNEILDKKFIKNPFYNCFF